VKKAWIYTTVGHSQRRKTGKSLPLFSNGSRINWNRRRVIELTDTHYKECDKNKASQLMILSQDQKI